MEDSAIATEQGYLQKAASRPSPLSRLDERLSYLDNILDELSAKIDGVLDKSSDTAPGGIPQEAGRNQLEDLLNVLDYRIQRLADINRRIIL